MAVTAMLCLGVQAGPSPPIYTDEFIRGYAAGLLRDDIVLTEALIHVANGVVTIACNDIGEIEKDKLINILSAVPGVRNVRVVTRDRLADIESNMAGRRFTSVRPHAFILFPDRPLFRWLAADQRWPHISASYRSYSDHTEVNTAGAISLGRSLPVIQYNGASGHRWELGIQLSVFALFDLEAPSTALVNTDPIVSIPLSYRHDRFSAILRLSHQSTHLGDEYVILHGPEVREDVSFEIWDVIVSYETSEHWRIYAGLANIIDGEPEDREPLSTRIGIEYRCPVSWSFVLGTVRPVAALDIQNRQENDWASDLSVRAGMEIESLRSDAYRFQVLAEFYNGHSPDGQFYRERVRYGGVGFRIYFD